MSEWGDDAPIIQRPKVSAAPRADAWGDDAPAIQRTTGKKKTSQTLGAYKEFARPLDNAAIWLEGAADAVGLADPINRLGEAIGLPTARESAASHRDYVKGREDAGERPGLIGSVVGGIAGSAPALAATRNPLLVGGLQGALLTEDPDDLGGVAMDAATGAALNKVAGVAVDKVSDALAPVISPAVEKLRQAGVRMTPGQIKGGKALAREDKAMSRPVVGERINADRTRFVDDFNRGAINRALMPLGIRLPDDIATGHDAVSFMQQAAGQAYEKVMPKLALAPDARLAAGFRKAQQITDTLPTDIQQTFANILRPNVDFNAQGGVMSGRQLTRSLRDLRDRAAGYSRSSLESERQLGAALGEIIEGMNSSLLTQNPQFAPMLKAANKTYRESLVVNRAAASADDGVASTAQFKTASRAVDRTKNKRATAAGRGPMQDYIKAGREVTGKTPNSGTAERLMDGNWLARGRGAIDAGLYEADKAMTALRLLPRSPGAKKVAGLLAEYRDPIRIAGGPVLGGLLSGLFASE